MRHCSVAGKGDRDEVSPEDLAASRPDEPGRFEEYTVDNISPDMSFLEMLDVAQRGADPGKGEEPIAFDSDCREGICGTCGLVIDGMAHGPELRHAPPASCTCATSTTATTITVEPWRADAFPVVKDLVVDRSAFDRIIAAGGYISVNTGWRARRQRHPRPQGHRRGGHGRGGLHRLRRLRGGLPQRLGRCCSSARRSSQLALLPQGQPEQERRVSRMVEQMDLEGFGNCSNHGECEAACPKDISIVNIARMRREYIRASVRGPA